MLRALTIAIGMLILPIAAVAQSTGLPTGLQSSSVLIIDSERLFSDSAFGQRVLTEQQAEAAVLAAEFRRIEAELTEEERALTEKRPNMTPGDFRKVADAFDERVESIRATQEQRRVDLVQRGESERQRFFSELGPVLETVLRDSGALVVLEKRTVFASSSALDVTDRILKQADLMLGDGATELPLDAPNDN